MTKSELILFIEEKIAEQEELMRITEPKYTTQYGFSLQAKLQYSWFLEELKNLNGETVKLREDCRPNGGCYVLHSILKFFGYKSK